MPFLFQPLGIKTAGHRHFKRLRAFFINHQRQITTWRPLGTAWLVSCKCRLSGMVSFCLTGGCHQVPHGLSLVSTLIIGFGIRVHS